MPRRTATPTTRRLTVAFVGDAPVKTPLVEELLDDFFRMGPKEETKDGFFPTPSPDDIEILLPISREWTTNAIGEILGWTGYADLPFVALTDNDLSQALERDIKDAQEVTETDGQINHLILDALEAAHDDGREAILVFAWGDDKHDRDARYEELLDDATNSDRIDRVLDLTAGMDDLSFDDPVDEPAKDPEPEPVPPPTARRRRSAAPEEPAEPTTRRRGRAAAEKPLEAQEKPLEDKPPARRRSKTPEEVKETGDKALESLREVRKPRQPKAPVEPQNGTEGPEDAALRYARTIHEWLAAVENARALSMPGIHVEPSPLLAQSAALYSILSGNTDEVTANAEAPKSRGGRPRRTGEPAQPRTPEDKAVAYIVEDGRYRKAGVGRKPRGQVRELLTEEQVAGLVAEGLVDDE